MSTATSRGVQGPVQGPEHGHPWGALWAMMLGFFMIMLDSTIVAVANPTIMTELHIGYDTVVWVTSAYLLGYAVVLLVAGRLGDRFGPKNLYLIGLVVFTAASVWCGLSGSAATLIAARVVQGVGAGLLTPQTMSTITRTFPAHRRGAAMSMWGATAGVASLIGPLAGGLLVDGLGWQWIFFVNVPVGVVALALAVWLIPVLPVHARGFDLIGVALSGAGIFLLVFGLQEGQSANWAPWIWAVLVAGVGFMSAFAYWQGIYQARFGGLPLVPLGIFRDRNYSLCNVGVAIISFATTAMMLPVTFYAQSVCGLSPTRSALLLAPMAIVSGATAPLVGTFVDRVHPLPVLGTGFSLLAVSMTWLSIELEPGTPIWRLVLPFIVLGAGMAFVWTPLAATATRNLPAQQAGAGSGVYNATRQLGAVLGSAGMAAFMTARIGAEMPSGAAAASGAAGVARDDGAGEATLQLPEFLREPFSAAMSQSVLLPAFVALFGIVAALFLLGAGGHTVGHLVGRDPDAGTATGDDDDDYVEYILRREPDHHDKTDTQPLVALARRSGPGPAAAGPSRPAPRIPPRNGVAVNGEQRLHPLNGGPRRVDHSGSGRHWSG